MVNTKDRIGKKMLGEYYRNGELFIAELIRRREENKAFLTTDEILEDVKVDDEFIKENFREPVIEFLGHSNVSERSTEGVIIDLFRKYFEVSGNVKKKLLFSMDIECEGDLNESVIPEKLKNRFKTEGFTLSEGAAVTKRKENEWVIGDKERFVVRKKAGKLNIYANTILYASFLNTKRGVCSYCGKETEVFDHISYIFPLYRKIDSITPVEAKLRFCKKCGFTLYCGMAYLYKKGKRKARKAEKNIRFFFYSHDFDALEGINKHFNNQEMLDVSNYKEINTNRFCVRTFHPYETLFVTFFEFVKYLKRKNLIKDVGEVIKNVKLILAAGSGQIYSHRSIEGNVLDKLTRFFVTIIEESERIYKGMERNKRPKAGPVDLIFSGFFNNLTINKGDFGEDRRLREEFTRHLFSEGMDFITLNAILMERKKSNLRFPFYYRDFIVTYMGVFGMDKELFERINRLGYELGKEMRGTNLENFVWEIHRARGAEQFYSSLVELQAKLKTSIDLRPINEYEKGWKEAKAILLNGMLNAIYGGKRNE